MREIKFRVWDDIQNKMLSSDYLAEYWGFSTLINTRERLMQFTGLLDKNEIEIYEGDILSEKWRVEVFFKDGSFWVNTKRWIHNKMHLDDFLKGRVKAGVPAEVIGNIWETPDLLS